MEIIVGKTAGFCPGVKNAITKTEQELEREKSKLYCLGELVHNKQVIEKLESKGLKTVENIEEVKNKTIIRAHGIPKQIYEKAEKMKIELIDLTCPKVLQIHKIAEEYAEKGYYIILVGVEKHPESIGTISFCGENSFFITDIEDVTKAIKNINKEKILVIAQTTYNLKKFEEIVKEIKDKIGNKIKIEVKNTICLATKIRQEETEELSKKVDIMIIVGGKNSSNTKKLYDIAKINCPEVKLVETVNDLDISKIGKDVKIGIMAGASTPMESIEEIKQVLLAK